MDIEYDKVLNFGVQRIYEELRNKFKFQNKSEKSIHWTISVVWTEREPAKFKISETEGELEPGKTCILNISYYLEEIEMYKGDLTLIIDDCSKVVIPVFTGGKSNIVIEPNILEMSNKNNQLENLMTTRDTFKVKNNNPFKVVFCWMHCSD